MRERIAVQIDIGKQHGIVAAGAQSRRIGKRSKANLGTWRTVNLVGLVIVGGATLVHLGANAIEHGHGRGLRHVERASIVHKDVDDMAQQGHLRLATGLAIQAAQRAIGQRLGNGKHGLERRHGLVTPQRLEHVRDHTRHILKPVFVARRLTRAPHLALNALQQALNARGSLAARETHILIERERAGGIGTRKRTVNPVGKLRRGPPLGLRGDALVGGLHALDQAGKRRKLPARDGLGKRRELSCLSSDTTSRQTRGELTEQLGCPGRNDEHACGVGVRRGAVGLGTLARFYQIINCVRIDMSTGMGAGDLNKGRLSGGPASGIRRAGILVQRRDLKQHTAGIKCRGKLLARRRLLADKQHDDLSPVVCHGGQQLEQAIRK